MWVNSKELLWPHISDMIYSTTRAYELDFLMFINYFQIKNNFLNFKSRQRWTKWIFEWLAV